MITTTMFPGRYVQGADAIFRLGEELAAYGPKSLLVSSPFVHNYILPTLESDFEKYLEILVEKFERECTDETIDTLTMIARENECDSICGFGGGKTIDTARVVAHNLDLPFVVVPSIASSDAPTSSSSVIYTPDGKYKRAVFTRRNPDLVLVDTQIISEAPVRYLVAGMGDALSTYFEAESCRIHRRENSSGDHGSLMAYGIARLCYDTVLEYGRRAAIDCQAGAVTPALEHIVEANTLLSGVGFESGGLAAAHSIHNGLTALSETHDYLHGEKVAFGVLTSLFYNDVPGELIDEVYDFCESVGLPTMLADIGLKYVTDLEIEKVAAKACTDGEFIHNEAGMATPERIAPAIKAANAYGRARRQTKYQGG
ncbi:MAG: glycerol dehydrogenase [Candidatus Kapaibacterium sp.]